MVSIVSRQLGEFLQEQQEPFILEVYLVERGCKKQRYLESCSKSTRCMKSTSTSLGLKGHKKFLPNCSKVVRSVFGRLLPLNSKRIILNSGNKNGRVGMSERESRKQKKQQSTVSDSCTESEEAGISSVTDEEFWPRFVDDCVLDENKVSVGWKFTWRDTGNSKQLSPVSVLDETESYHCSPNDIEFRRIEEELLHSVSASKLEKRNGVQEVDINFDNGSNTLFQFNRNKKAVQQAKHLLLDCLLEVVDSRSPELIGTEQLRQLMCENQWLWSKEALNESSINHLTNFDALASDKTLKNCEQQRQEIGMVVGDAILEDIYNEFFAEMMGGFSS